MRVHLADDSHRELWQSYLARHNVSHHAHRWEWRDVFSKTFGHQPFYLLARRPSDTNGASSEGAVVGILPLYYFRSFLFGKSFVSVPYLNSGGIIADDQEAFDALVETANEFAAKSGASYIELRHREKISLVPIGLTDRSHKVAMILPLVNDPEEQFQGFRAKLRSQIRRPTKSGLHAEVSGESMSVEDSVHAFYKVFSENMRDLGTPVYPRRLFEATAKNFKTDCRIVTVWNKTKPVAAGLTVKNNNSVEIPWASSLRAHNKESPNMLLYWTAIKQAVLDGASEFDFGRSSPDSGPYRFKAQWGSKPLPLHWYYSILQGEIPDVNPNSAKYRLLVQCWQRLPLPMANALGPWITKGLP